MSEFQLRVQDRDYLNGFDCLLFVRDDNGQRHVVVPIEEGDMQEMREGEYNVPSFSLDTSSAQQLMDDLYRSGLRPTAAEDGSGTKLHLADMRAIVASKLGVTLK